MDPDEISRRAEKERLNLKKSENLAKKASSKELDAASKIKSKLNWKMNKTVASVASASFIFGTLFLYIYLQDYEIWAFYSSCALFSLLFLSLFFHCLQMLFKYNSLPTKEETT